MSNKDFKRLEFKVPHDISELWLHHIKQAGFETQQEAGVAAFQMHLNYIMSGESSFFLVDELLYESTKDEEELMEQMMANRLQRHEKMTIIYADGEIERCDSWGTSYTSAMLAFLLGIFALAGFALGRYLL